jgi:hypothetical protein
VSSPVVAAAAEHWDSLLAEDDSLEQGIPALREWMVEHGLRIGDRPLCNVLRPHLVAEEDLRRTSAIAERIISAVYKVRDGLLANLDLHARHLGRFREWIGDLLDLDARPAGDGALLRLDASLARTQLHYIELNADTPAGMGHNDALVSFFQELDAYGRFAERYRVRPLRLEDALRETMLATFEAWGGNGVPTIAIVTHTEDPVRTSSLETDIRCYREHGVDASIVDFRELSYDAGRLRHEGGEIDLVHRVMMTSECLDERDVLAPLFDALRDGAVCMVNPFRSELLGHKAIFALLTDPSHEFGFTARERETIRTHVPWTRQMFDGKATDPGGDEVDLVPYVLEHRDRLVLKPTHDYGGHGVRLGWRESDSEWEDSVRRALDSDYIAQHRVELRREEYPTMTAPIERRMYYEDTDPFLFRGKLGGMLTRLSPGELTNVHAAGSVVAPFAIEPR